MITGHRHSSLSNTGTAACRGAVLARADVLRLDFAIPDQPRSAAHSRKDPLGLIAVVLGELTKLYAQRCILAGSQPGSSDGIVVGVTVTGPSRRFPPTMVRPSGP